MSSVPAPSTPRPTYRIRELRRRDATPKGYRFTLEVGDELTGEKLATGDVIGHGAIEIAIDTATGARWNLTANRKLLPTCFSLADETGCVDVQFDLQVGRKLIAPLTRVALVLRDGSGVELMRLADMRTSLGDRVFGTSLADWSLLRGDDTVATLTYLASREPRAKGIRRWVLAVLTPSDRGLVSFGEQHVISPPAALAMLAVFNDLTKNI